jgi:hypothetical protein
MNGRHLGGTQILRVNAASGFGKDKFKQAELLFATYRQIAGEESLFPPMIGLVLDRDKLKEQEIETLKEKSRYQDKEGKYRHMAKFLDRRMYENYLLHPKAIASIINKYDEFRDKCLTDVEVQNWIEQKKQEGLYLPKGVNKEKISNAEWFCKVDGAKLLKDIFADLSDARIDFRKTRDSPELTKWLLEHEPNYLSELAEFLQNVLEQGEEKLKSVSATL